MAVKQRTSVMQASIESSVKRFVEGSLRNKLFTTKCCTQQEFLNLLTQGLNEKLVCENRRADVLCLRHKGRTSAGKCV